MALSRSEEKRILEILEENPAGHAPAYCVEHLASRAGLRSERLDDLRTFVRALRALHTVAEQGVCDTGPHAVTDLVIRARAPGPRRT